ncbi:MAG: signal peptidase I, partial [Candidatus Bathyarchaeota archaeon]
MFDRKVKSGHAPKLLLRAKKLIRSMCYLVVFMAVLSFVSSMVFKAASPVGTITSKSMMPVLDIGDIVFIQPSRLEDVHVGEIIAFQATPRTTIVHRVERELLLPEKTYLITKGDANDITDQSVGIPPVKSDNFLGKVLCIDGFPVKIPIIGQLWMQIYNFSVQLTQDKPWSFWAPVLAAFYICWPSLSKGKKLYQKHFTRRTINKKQIFVIAFIAFTAISLFTLWFRNEQYTVGLRIASLLDFDKKHNFSYGSMIYGQIQDNELTLTGAPMFPVKAVSIVNGNASLLSTVNPKSIIVEPNAYLKLDLHTEVPARGEITPGLYEGTVYIFSSWLWTFIPDDVIFWVFSSFSNPWVSAVSVELLGAFALASLIAVFLLLAEFLAKQTAYTYVWLRHLPEKEAPPRYLLLIKSLKMKMCLPKEFLSRKINRVASAFSIEGKIRNLKIFLAIAAISYITFLLGRSFIFSAILESSLSGLYAISRRLRHKEAYIGVMFTHVVYSCILITHNAISSLYSFYGFPSLAATGFTGLLFAVLTVPILFTIFFLTFRTLVMLKILSLEQETMMWVAFRKVKFVWPAFEKAT